MENNRSINASEAHKAIEKIVSEGNPKEVGIFIVYYHIDICKKWE